MKDKKLLEQMSLAELLEYKIFIEERIKNFKPTKLNLNFYWDEELNKVQKEIEKKWNLKHKKKIKS